MYSKIIDKNTRRNTKAAWIVSLGIWDHLSIVTPWLNLQKQKHSHITIYEVGMTEKANLKYITKNSENDIANNTPAM